VLIGKISGMEKEEKVDKVRRMKDILFHLLTIAEIFSAMTGLNFGKYL
jgi:hypothetical protein